MTDEERDSTDEEVVEAINELVAGIMARWHREPNTGVTVVANALGALVAKLDLSKDTSDRTEPQKYCRKLYIFVDTARDTMFDTVEKLARR